MMESPEMNTQNQENPWRAPEGIPSAGPVSIAGAAVLFAVASAAIPISLIKPWVGMALWAVLLGGLFVLIRRMRTGIALTMILSVAAFFLSGSYLFVGPLAAALAVGTCAGAFLLTTLKKPWLACLIPLVSAGITAIFTQDWLFLVFAFALLPAAALLAFATRRGMGRTSAICCGAAGLIGAALLLMALAIARTDAGLSLGTVTSLLDSWKAGLLAERQEMRDALLAMLEQSMQNTGAAGTQSGQAMLDYYRRLLSDANLYDDLTQMFNVLPGAAVAVGLIASFLAQRLLLETYDANGMRRVITPESEFLTVSLPASVIYLVAVLITLIFSSSYAVPVITANNLVLILTPGLCAVGWQFLCRSLRAIPTRGRWILIFPALALLCCASTSAIYIFAAYGAYATIFSAVRHAIDRKNGGAGPQDGDGPDSPD